MSRSSGVGPYFLVVATTGVIQNCATTLREEIGCRGFLVPELAKRFSFTATSVLSGAIWVLWHVPIILFARLQRGNRLVWFSRGLGKHDRPLLRSDPFLRSDIAASEIRELLDRGHSARLQQPLHLESRKRRPTDLTRVYSQL